MKGASGVDRLGAVMRSAGIKDAIVANEAALGLVARVGATRITDALGALRDDDHEMLVDLFATDTGSWLEITYHLRRLEDAHEVFVKTRADHGGAIPSACGIYPAALLAERDAAARLGMTFRGQPGGGLKAAAGGPPLLRKAVVIVPEPEGAAE
jgi:NADH:ubiquinone oxidoreductase subunit C